MGMVEAGVVEVDTVGEVEASGVEVVAVVLEVGSGAGGGMVGDGDAKLPETERMGVSKYLGVSWCDIKQGVSASEFNYETRYPSVVYVSS